MIRKISPPPGWSKNDLEYVALVARFHRRALPYPDHTKLRVYELPLRQSLIRLAAILRMANAFHAKRYKTIRRLQVENGPGYLVIRAEGFRDRDPIRFQSFGLPAVPGICFSGFRAYSRARNPHDGAANRAHSGAQRRRIGAFVNAIPARLC